MGKKKGFKNILMPPFGIEWPKVDKDTEEKIITALTLKLQEFPSLESKRTKDARRKSGQPDSDAVSQPERSPEDDDKLRARLRQQLVIGYRQVTRSLERNQLALVLVSNDAQPTILLRSLLPLVASRRCPGICFSNLSLQLTEAVGVTSVLALGFKKSQPDEPNDFEEFVAMAAALAPPLSVPWASQDTGGSTDVDCGGDGLETENKSSAESMGQEEDVGDEISSPAKDGLLMAPDEEREVLTKLLELLTPYEALFQKPRSKYTPEELQTRKTINSGMTMDLAAVRSAVCSDQLDLLLVQHKHRDPHPVLLSAVKTAVEKGCPVLQMTALKSELCGVVRNSHLLAVGFKKSRDRPIKPPEKFRQFVAMASQYIPSHLGSSASSQPKESSSREEEKSAEPTSKEKRRKQKAPSPVYDVSSLYVYKKDNQNSGTETPKKADSSSETFISLSSEPTIQYLGVKSMSAKTTLSDIAFVDSKGTHKQRLTTEKPVETEEPDVPMQTSESVEFEVMGMDSVDAPAVSKPFYHEPRAKKPKANLKRKLDQRAGHGEFVSFKIRPTNIQVSVPNPNKKKHKKFKKK